MKSPRIMFRSWGQSWRGVGSTRRAIAAIATAVLTAQVASAQTTVTWTGGGADANWGTSGNWSTGGPPTTTGTWALTFAGSTRTTSSDNIGGTSDTITLSSLTFSNTTGSSFTLNRANSRTLTLANGFVLTTGSGGPNNTISIPLVMTAGGTASINANQGTSNLINLTGGVTGGGTIIVNGNAQVWTSSPAGGGNDSTNYVVRGGSLFLSNPNTAVGVYTLDGGTEVAFTGGAFTIPATVSLLKSGQVRARSSSGTFSAATFNGASAATSDVTLTLDSGVGYANVIQGVVQDNTSNKLGVTVGALNAAGWTFLGANTYTGTTRITTGTLTLGNGGTAGSLSPSSTITGAAAGTLRFNRSDTIVSGVAFNNVIGGTISVTQMGSGTVVLAGANTYTGTTSVNAGTLQIGNAGTAGSLSGSSTITGSAGGTLAFSRADNYGGNFGNTIGGGLAVSQIGTGTLTLSGSNSYTGSTTVSNGSLVAGSTNAFGAQSGNITVAGGALNLGNYTFARTGTVSFRGGTTQSGTITNGTVAYDAQAGTVSAVLAGSVGLTKSTTGAFTLSGVNTYAGSTTISAGILEVAPAGTINATSGITVNGTGAELKYNSTTALSQSLALTQGTLSGTGTINTAVVINSGAVHSPGSSPGIQAVASETWGSGGTYLWELNSLSGTAGTAWDQIAVTGLLGLDTLSTGGNFNLNLVTLTGGNVAGPLDTGYVAGSNYQFTIATFGSLAVPDGFFTTPGSDLTGLFNINLDGWQGTKPSIADISVKVNASGGIDLVIVPEPGSLALAGLAAVCAGWLAAKRGRRTG